MEPAEAPNRMDNTFRSCLIISGALTLLLAALTAWAYFKVEPGQKIPIHWNARGEIDGWSSRAGLWLMPGVMLFHLALFSVLPRIEPKMGKALYASKAYGATMVGVMIVLFITQVGVIAATQQKDFPMLPLISTAVGGLLCVIGNYFGKIRTNYIMGVRTPWTLTSELSWNKTHRLAGRLLAILGLAIMIVCWLPGSENFSIWVIVGGILALTAITTVYSYFVWKNDPDKEKATKSI